MHKRSTDQVVCPVPTPRTREAARQLLRLIEVMARTRDPDHGCPWSVRQNFASIAPFTLEESYEVAEVIERDDLDSLPGELGDLLYQVVFYARMAEEAELFDFADIAKGITDKLIRRKSWVFGDDDIREFGSALSRWEEHKAAERKKQGGTTSIMDGISLALPALVRAQKIQSRAATVGFDWEKPIDVLDKIIEEAEEVRAELACANIPDPIRVRDEIGDLLFSVVNLSRRLHVDSEQALRIANQRLSNRIRHIEQLLNEAGKCLDEATMPEMDALWDQAKREEKQDGGGKS